MTKLKIFMKMKIRKKWNWKKEVIESLDDLYNELKEIKDILKPLDHIRIETDAKTNSYKMYVNNVLYKNQNVNDKTMEFKEQIERLENDNKLLEIQKNKIMDNNQEQSKRIKELEKENEQLKEKLKTNESYNKRLEIKIDNEIEDHKLDLETKDNEIEKLKQTIECYKGQVEDRDNLLESSKMTITKLENEIQKMQDSIDEEFLPDHDIPIKLDPTDLD